MRNFKWYRKFKGGKWFYVRHWYNTEDFFWFHESECPEYPEYDGLFMDDMSTAYFGWGYDRSHPYYGWKDMETTPTEQW